MYQYAYITYLLPYYFLAAGPFISCNKDRIDIEFDGRALTDESLIADQKYVALSGFTNAPQCRSQAYVKQPGDDVTVFKLSVPKPLDVACGSDMTVRDRHIFSRLLV